MKNTKQSIFSKEFHPLTQAKIVLAVNLIVTVVRYLLYLVGYFEANLVIYWIISATFFLFFGLLNIIFSLSYTNQKQYWMYSLISFFIVLVVGALVAYLFSGIPIQEAKSIRWIYIVFIVGYIVFLSIIRAMRQIVIIAQEADKKG